MYVLFIKTTGCEGNDLFWPWFMWLLGAFLLGALLGWLLKSLFGGGEDQSKRIDHLRAELDDCKRSKANLANVGTAGAASFTGNSSGSGNASNIASSFAGGAVVSAASSKSESVSSVAFDAAAAKAAFGKKIKENDLTIVEGIGPKIQELFHNHDVKTWLGLSECSQEKCKEVLLSGGNRFKMHNPSTWPKQAKFAAEGKWTALKKWQDELDGGR